MAPLSYSAAVSGSEPGHAAPSRRITPTAAALPNGNVSGDDIEHPRPKRSRSPSHRPQGVAENEDVYVLTLLTDKPHHDRMTALRKQYFPKHINKLEAHLTLFHALPGSKLESSIIPTLQDVARQTTPFKVRATKPFRLKKGVAISVAKTQSAAQTQEVHRALRQPWLDEGFLSDQDRGGCHVHYTIMNKVDDESEVLKALEEVQQSFQSDVGQAVGLGLWRYDRGWWRWERRFDFENTGSAKATGVSMQ